MNWLALLLTGSWELGQAADDEWEREPINSRTLADPVRADTIMLTAGMNTVDLVTGRRGKGYGSVGSPVRVVGRLNRWVGQAIQAEGTPVVLPTSILIESLRPHYSDEFLVDLPYEAYMGYSGVAFSVEESLQVIVLDPLLKMAIAHFAFSYHSNPAFWNALLKLLQVEPVPEPATPWAAEFTVDRQLALHPGAMYWLSPLERALANLFMMVNQPR